MIQVQLLYRRADSVTDGGVLITDGLVRCFPARRYDSAGGEMTTQAFTAEIGDTVSVDPGTWGFELVRVPDGRGGYLKGRDALQYKLVPNTGGPYQVDDLTDVSPTGDTAPLDPEWRVYIDQQIATVGGGAPTGSGPGGSFIAIDVQDTTTVGRAVMTATDAAAARTAISAPSTAGPTFTGTTAVANLTVSGTTSFVDGSIAQADINGLVAALALLAPLASPALTGNPTAPTASPGDSDTSIATTAFVAAAINAALANVEYPHYAVGGTYPGRPVTDRPVTWRSWDVAPPATAGTTTSGTGPVVGLDIVYLAVGVVPG